MVAIQKGSAGLQDIRMDIRQMAAKMVRHDGVIDRGDVKDMLRRATPDGHLSKKNADDLAFVCHKYKDHFTADALGALSMVLGAFADDQIKQAKEHEREKKIERHLLEIEDRIQLLMKDRKLREMDVDKKSRVIVTELFGRRKTRT
ncbi:MAG: hypothetical protein HY904_26035 [Deltaproteobacteria bacterium]|nr:hypothetical protein [Deltaproteobacteria bacterium]